jgi:hypothetical protein
MNLVEAGRGTHKGDGPVDQTDAREKEREHSRHRDGKGERGSPAEARGKSQGREKPPPFEEGGGRRQTEVHQSRSQRHRGGHDLRPGRDKEARKSHAETAREGCREPTERHSPQRDRRERSEPHTAGNRGEGSEPRSESKVVREPHLEKPRGGDGPRERRSASREMRSASGELHRAKACRGKVAPGAADRTERHRRESQEASPRQVRNRPLCVEFQSQEGWVSESLQEWGQHFRFFTRNVVAEWRILVGNLRNQSGRCFDPSVRGFSKPT